MTLAAGTSLGPYKILGSIGAGGMGEVYRAVDPRLGREVAIKVLPHSSADADRVQRFTLEARAASALNHPNIVSVFDIGTDQGTPYIVSELLEGQNLREALNAQTKLPFRRAVDYAIQMANGLSAAHQKGIVHRDLKPENVFVCRDGRVKILDFGLAKLSERAPVAADNLTASATTDPGTVLGTMGYMSPEQVRGHALDARSDIFSFGAVLYEMLTGQRAFVGGSSADVASAILKEEPKKLTEFNQQSSPAMQRVVHHCLEKEPAERFQTAKDLSFALQSASSVSDSAAYPKADNVKSSPRNWLWLVAGILLLATATVLGRWTAQPSVEHRVMHSQRLTDFLGIEEYPALSPDGKSVAFISDSSGTKQLFVRLLSGGVPLQLTRDPVNHLYPRWSHDSGSLIYYTPPDAGETEGKLWQVPALGGFPRQLTNSSSGADVDHASDRLTYFKLENGKLRLVVTDRDGSNLQTIFENTLDPEHPTFEYSFPRWSPDDKQIAYQHGNALWSDDVYVVAAAPGSQPKRVTLSAKMVNGLSWTPDGKHIVYSSAVGTTVMYLPSMQLWMVGSNGEGAQQLTYEDVVYEHPDVEGGRIVAARRQMQFDLWRFPAGPDAKQNVAQGLRLTGQSGRILTPTVSPDDSEVAFLSDSGGHGNIWVKNLKSGELRQITFEHDPTNTIGTPVWSPVKNQIAYATTRTGENWARIGYTVVNSDGSNPHELVDKGAWAAWSGDGKFLYYADALPTQAANGSRLMKIPDTGGSPTVVRTDPGVGPAPAYDGSALYYLIATQNLAVGLDFEIRAATPETGTPKVLAHIPAVRSPQWQGLHLTITHDGKWLALPLNDEYGSNIWVISTRDGTFRKLMDFGQERTFIARRVSWSHDDKYIFAAVAVGQEDIVLLDGLLSDETK